MAKAVPSDNLEHHEGAAAKHKTESDETTFTCLSVVEGAEAAELTLDALVGATKSPASSSRSKSAEL